MMTTEDINKIIDENEHNSLVDADDISDGFHTFGQLYFQRMMLFATLVNLFPELSWKTKRHEDGEKCFGSDDWFLVTIDTPAGAYGYHYEMKYWDMFKCNVLDKAKHWDGYTEENVDRLFSLIVRPEPLDENRCICDCCTHYFDKDTSRCDWCCGDRFSNFEPINKEDKENENT